MKLLHSIKVECFCFLKTLYSILLYNCVHHHQYQGHSISVQISKSLFIKWLLWWGKSMNGRWNCCTASKWNLLFSKNVVFHNVKRSRHIMCEYLLCDDIHFCPAQKRALDTMAAICCGALYHKRQSMAISVACPHWQIGERWAALVLCTCGTRWTLSDIGCQADPGSMGLRCYHNWQTFEFQIFQMHLMWFLEK